jgi:hypothetical protein
VAAVAVAAAAVVVAAVALPCAKMRWRSCDCWEGSTLGVHIVDLADAVVLATCEECGAMEALSKVRPAVALARVRGGRDGGGGGGGGVGCLACLDVVLVST